MFFFIFGAIFLRKQHGDAHIKHHADDVVGDRDKRAGGNGGVYFQLFQRHGNQRAEDGCEHHHGKEADGYRIGDCGRRAEAHEVVDVHQQRDDGGIDGGHDGFPAHLFQRVLGVQRTVGQALHDDGRRLRAQRGGVGGEHVLQEAHRVLPADGARDGKLNQQQQDMEDEDDDDDNSAKTPEELQKKEELNKKLNELEEDYAYNAFYIMLEHAVGENIFKLYLLAS